MDLEVRRAQDVYALLAREQSSRQWVLQACEELGFDIKSLKYHSLADFERDASSSAIQRLRHEHYSTRRSFKIEKVVEYLADRGLLDELQIRYLDNKRRRQSASPSVYRKAPSNDVTFLTDVSIEVKTFDIDHSKIEKAKKVQENLVNLKLEQEKKRLGLLEQWTQRYSKLDKEQKKHIKLQQEKNSLKDQRRKDLLAQKHKRETDRELEEIRKSYKRFSARESVTHSRAPESGRHSRIIENHSRSPIPERKLIGRSASGDDVGRRLRHIESKLERSEIIAKEHRKTKSSTAAAGMSQV